MNYKVAEVLLGDDGKWRLNIVQPDGFGGVITGDGTLEETLNYLVNKLRREEETLRKLTK